MQELHFVKDDKDKIEILKEKDGNQEWQNPRDGSPGT